jgi:endonuclease/exonuclease/phosphatase family metal-dependent hydrolase
VVQADDGSEYVVTNATNESVSSNGSWPAVPRDTTGVGDRAAIEASADMGSAPGATDRIRVLTWNLWWRFGAWRERRNAIVAELARVAPDVCGLQEVWDDGEENQAGSIAADLGWHSVWAPSPSSEQWQRRLGATGAGIAFGNAVLSRWPIAGSAVNRLPAAVGIDDGRLALHAMIASPFGAIPVFTTQLTSAWGHSRIRQEQVAAVCRFITERGHGGFPPVLTGDFNAPPDADEIRCLVGKADPPVPGVVLLDAWAYARPLELGWTWDRRNPHVAATLEPDARIDYVFVGPPDTQARGHILTAELVGVQPKDGVWPSDHMGVLAELRGGASDDGVVS